MYIRIKSYDLSYSLQLFPNLYKLLCFPSFVDKWMTFIYDGTGYQSTQLDNELETKIANQ